MIEYMKPRISVVIPVYNAERYLERCLDSLLTQSFGEWEAICVDDGSKDASNSILQEYASKDRRVIVIGQENGGAAAARNTGLKKAQSDFVFFLDSDDELEPSCLEVLWKEVEQHPNVELVVGANRTIDEKGNSRPVTYGEPCYVENNEWVRFNFFKDDSTFYVVPWNKLVRKSFLIENSLLFKEGIIHEDEHWSYYLYKKLRNISITEEVTYLHYVTPDSVMSTNTVQKRAETLSVILSDFMGDFDEPCYAMQVFRCLELFRNYVHPYISKAQSRPLYFSYFRELIKIRQNKIAFYWLVNWFHDYRHYQLYYKMIPEAYRGEMKRCAMICKATK